MSKTVTIQIQNIPQNFPAHWLAQSGTAYLDLPSDFSLSKTKNEETVSRFDGITGQGVLGFSLPATDRNTAVWNCFLQIGSVSDSGDALVPVIAIENGFTLQQNTLRFIGRTDEAQEIEVELLDGEDFWKTALESVRLNELEFGIIDLNEANLLDIWQNKAAYQDGDQGVYFPLVHYGNWIDPATYNDDGDLTAATTASVEDFRPCFHILAVLQKMFAKVGWTFRSPILETDMWRSRGAYLGIDYEGGPGLDGFKFRAEVDEDYLVQNTPDTTFNLHALPVFDNPGVYNVDPADPDGDIYYVQGLCGTFTFTVVLNMEVPVNSIVSVAFVQDGPSGLNIQNVEGGVLQPSDTFTAVSPPFELVAADRAYFSVTIAFGQSPATHTILKGSYIFNTPISVGICEDMSLPVDAYIRDYPSLDYFAGVLHILGGGRIATDFATKTVTVYHPFRAELPGEPTIVEAFYLTPDKAKDITGVIECKSLALTRNRIEVARFYRISYAEHDDYLEEQGYSNENPAFAHVEDYGERYNNDFEDDTNPFFEATGEIEATDIAPAGEKGVLVPAMWDNDDRTRFATDIGPRIINFAGYVEQNLTASTTRKWSFKGNSQALLPFAYLETAAFIGADLEKPDLTLAYGGVSGNTNYELYWKNVLATKLRDRAIQFTALIDHCFFLDQLVFRRPYLVRYRGETALFLLKSIGDFESAEDGLTALDFEVYPIVSEFFEQGGGVIQEGWELIENGFWDTLQGGVWELI